MLIGEFDLFDTFFFAKDPVLPSVHQQSTAASRQGVEMDAGRTRGFHRLLHLVLADDRATTYTCIHCLSAQNLTRVYKRMAAREYRAEGTGRCVRCVSDVQSDLRYFQPGLAEPDYRSVHSRSSIDDSSPYSMLVFCAADIVLVLSVCADELYYKRARMVDSKARLVR